MRWNNQPGRTSTSANDGTERTPAITASRDQRGLKGAGSVGMGNPSEDGGSVLMLRQHSHPPGLWRSRVLGKSTHRSPSGRRPASPPAMRQGPGMTPAIVPRLGHRIAFQPSEPGRNLPGPLADGVMAAQGSLKPLVMVRIHVGQPSRPLNVRLLLAGGPGLPRKNPPDGGFSLMPLPVGPRSGSGRDRDRDDSRTYFTASILVTASSPCSLSRLPVTFTFLVWLQISP